MTACRHRHVLPLASLALLASLASAPAQTVATAGTARDHLTVLSGEIGSRPAGSLSEQRAADYIAGVFRRIGYETVRQPFSFISRERGGRPRTLESSNVIAIKSGDSDRELIVGAHYDSAGPGRGADDNASGVGVMLEVAAAVREVATPYTVRFVAFGAEERGLTGSRHYVAGMEAAEIRNTVAMINVDSLIAGDIAYVYGSEGDSGVLRDWILDRAAGSDAGLVTQGGANPEYPAGTTGDFSDHAPFENAGIEYAYFESTNWALGERDGYVQVDPRYGEGGYIWHTPYDTLDYIETHFPGRADARLQLFSRMLYRVLTEFSER